MLPILQILIEDDLFLDQLSKELLIVANKTETCVFVNSMNASSQLAVGYLVVIVVALVAWVRVLTI